MAILDLDAASSPFALPEVWDAVTVAGKVWTGKVEIKGDADQRLLEFPGINEPA